METLSEISFPRVSDYSVESLLSLLNLAHDGILFVDQGQHIVWFNRGAEQIFGYTADEVLGTKLDRLIPARYRETHHRHVDDFRDAEHAARPMNQRKSVLGLRRSGEEFPVEAALSKIQRQGEWLFMVVVRDISERQHLLEELISYRTTLEQRVKERTLELTNSNAELEAFSYSVSHDLRAPLRSIDGYSLALLEDYGDHFDDTGRLYLERLRSATINMGLLIENMLMLSRVTRYELVAEQLDLSTMAVEKITQLREDAQSREITTIVHPNLYCRGDAHLMRIALHNLIDNAWKYTSKRTDARIEIGEIVNDVGEVVYYVKDNGAGFNMAYANKLFVAFQRLHAVEDFAGTGIGLATVNRIIKRHGGRIWAESEVDRGATFYFTLPIT